MPKLILLEDFNGDTEIYLNEVFSVFKKDFMNNDLKCNGIKVFYIHQPEYKGKPFSFWHLVSEGKIEDQRNTDLRRCEKIGWPRVIIENPKDESIKTWKTDRRNKKGKIQKRLCLCFGEWEYLVVLTIRKNFFVLCTAYPVSTNRRRYQLKNEYDNFNKDKKQTPPSGAASDAPSTSW